MTQVINLPEGGTASFPDAMAQDQIESTLQQHYKENPISETQNSAMQQAAANKVQTDDQSQFPISSRVGAIAGGVLKGPADAVGDTAELGMNIVKLGANAILNHLVEAGHIPDSLAKKIQDNAQMVRASVEHGANEFKNNLNSLSMPMIHAHPALAAIPSALTYVGTGGALANAATNQISKGVMEAPIIGQALKNTALAQSPVASGMIKQGVSGALQGAGANPDHPLAGAITGSILGAGAGYAGAKIDRAAQIIDNQTNLAIKAGLDPNSKNVMMNIKQELSNNGKALTNRQIEEGVTSSINKQIQALPNTSEMTLTENPAKQISKIAAARFPEVEATKNANYAPLNESKAPALPTQTSQVLANAGDSIHKSLLPKISLNPNSSISDLMQYRREVQQGLTQATKQVSLATGPANFKTIRSLGQLKNAVTQDIAEAAKPAGLEDQLAKADSYHANEYSPFKVFNTDTGKLKSPNDIRQAWTTTARLLKTKFPNFDRLNDIATTLGPQGKELMGRGLLQSAVLRATKTGSNRVDAAQLATEFKRFRSSGLSDTLTPEHQEAFLGATRLAKGMEDLQNPKPNIVDTAEGAKAMVNTKPDVPKGVLADTLNGVLHPLTQNVVGIKILRALGNTHKSPEEIDNAVQQVLKSLVIIHGSRALLGYKSKD